MTSNSPSVASASSSSLEQQQWWHKPLIWGGFLVLLYLLREFFLIGFLTFLICFVVRSVVGFLSRRISPNRERRWLDLTLTLSVFLVICVAVYGVGRYFVPQVVRQARSLVVQIQNTTPEKAQNSVLANTVGSWKFRVQFGDSQDSRYQGAFEKFQESGRIGEGLYDSLPRINSRLQAEFEAEYEHAQVLHLRSNAGRGTSVNTEFEQWLLQTQVPGLFDAKSGYYIARWEAEYALPGKAGVLEALKQQSDYETVRDQQIHQRILADVKSDPVQLAEFQDQWSNAESIRQWARLRQSPGYQEQFKQFYEARRKNNLAAAPVDYAFYKTLTTAYPRGKDAFLSAVRQHFETNNQSLADQQHDFETATRLDLGQTWWATSHAADWVRDHAKEDGPKVLETVAGRFERGLSHLVRVPIQVGTALLLAIFILIEWHGLKHGVANIRDTRLRPIYDEIVPGVVALGKLIGKSFQGQVLIALFNAVITLIALTLIGVDYKFILTLVVFVFSFIPVIGVILSGIPLCAVALFQPGGSLVMVLEVVAAIAVIHLIEGMVLSPRIIGKIGHLHPVLVIAILLVAEHFFGMWGLILGVPVAIYIIRVVILKSAIPGVYDPEPSDGPDSSLDDSIPA